MVGIVFNKCEIETAEGVVESVQRLVLPVAQRTLMTYEPTVLKGCQHLTQCPATLFAYGFGYFCTCKPRTLPYKGFHYRFVLFGIGMKNASIHDSGLFLSSSPALTIEK